MNRRAYAMGLWENFAIPIRFSHGRVSVIWAPHDVMGAPIIHTYSPERFLAHVAGVLASMGEEVLRAERRFQKLTVVTAVLALVCLVLLARVVR
jgi:hypothetical protein